jgi:hypothetical protein
MPEHSFTPKESAASLGHPATCRTARGVASSASVRILRTGRGTRPLPLHPLPSSPFRRGQTKKPPTPVDTDNRKKTHVSLGNVYKKGLLEANK